MILKYSVTERKYRIVLIQNILNKNLRGHSDLIKYIMELDNVNEMNILINEQVEIDFYNWLTHDMVLRELINGNGGNHLKAGVLGFYQNNYEALGLLDYNSKLSYERTKSLSGCFNSKWWMTTHKSHYNDWSNIIHKLITFPYKILILDGKEFHGLHDLNIIQDNELVSTEIFIELKKNNFRKPNLKEKNNILERLIKDTLWISPDWLYSRWENGFIFKYKGDEYLLTDKNLEYGFLNLIF